MRYAVCFILFLLVVTVACRAQDSLLIPEPQVVPLEDLITEALARNPVVLGSIEKISIVLARERQAGVLDPPQLTYIRNEMPEFRWPDAHSTEWELMQMVKFPSKYSTENRIGEIQSEHSHHEAQETVNEVLFEIRQMYAELWYVQQRSVLLHENLRITERLKDVAAARYQVGAATRNDMLMAEMLRTTTLNLMIELRQAELGLKSRLAAILDRQQKDTLGYAVVPEEPTFNVLLESVLSLTMATRPVLIHDSLGILEQEEMLTSASQGYLPDLRLGVSYMDSDDEMFNGWSVTAGITLPFFPWTLGKTAGGVEEAEHRVNLARESYASTRNNVIAEVRASWFETTGRLTQLKNIASSMLPAAEQALKSSLSLYQNGETEYLMVHQAYTSFLEAQTEYFLTRMEFEKSIAKLRFTTGYNGDFQ